MEYIIIIGLAAVAGYFFFRQRNSNKVDVDRIRETYVCDRCGETLCDCHKEEV